MTPTATTQAVETTEPESLKETLESIVIALILAFVFRAFIVEAFVIPTGSMAPTLYGAHGTILCEDCGVEFAYGVKDPADTRKLRPVLAGSRARCPNCNHVNTHLSISDERRNADKGDRILVMKWPLDMGVDALEPKRWEVTVFKDPADGTTNFIKRLVGLPGEVIMIVHGDVYTVPLAQLSKETLSELDELRHEKYLLRTGQQLGRLRSPSAGAMAELDKKMSIPLKPRSAQEALWFVVYDHDHPPRTLDPGQPAWVPALAASSGWDATTRRVRFTDRGGSNDYIVLAGKDIRATCAYNIYHNPAQPVADLRTRFVLTPRSKEGLLCLRMEKESRAFWACLDMDGTVTLLESQQVPDTHTPFMARRKLPPFAPDRSVEISFENVDYRLAIHVDGEEVLSSQSDPKSPAYYAPDLSNLRHTRAPHTVPPRIYGEGGSWEMTHLIVEHDIYYYHDASIRALPLLPWAPVRGWASPDQPLLLREHEYFMLGDNTAASKDSRLWDQVGPHLTSRGDDYQLGTVPRDQLIGHAFFVYWPSGHSIPWLPRIGMWRWRIIPDVGRMRWIR